MVMSACAPPPLEVFLSPNPSFQRSGTQPKPLRQEQKPEYQPVSPYSAIMVQAAPSYSTGTTLSYQLNDALAEAEAHVRAGEARLREQNPLEAIREFERARRLIEQDVDPTLQYIVQQSTVQGGTNILSTSRIQQIRGQREDLLSRINRSYDFGTMYAQQQEKEKLKALRNASKPILQPIRLSEETYMSGRSRLLMTPQPKQPVPISSALNLTWLSDDEITRHISRFQQRHTDFRSCLVRANQYFPQVTSILTAKGIPEDLAYIALIESGFQPSAKSSSGDAGLWQISRATARSYGLKVTSQVDERVNIEPSTRAFARYMSHLYRRFGSWELAIIAYEVGEQVLQNTINRVGSYDLHVLKDHIKSYSPERTYLARFAAGMVIAKNPGSYGFDIDLSNVTGQLTLQTGKPQPSASSKMMLEPPVVTLY